MKISLVLLLAALGAGPAMASTVNIRSCNDGDTCRTTAGERIRLACIDAPESGRAGSYAAEQLAIQLNTDELEPNRGVFLTREYLRRVKDLTSGKGEARDASIDGPLL